MGVVVGFLALTTSATLSLELAYCDQHEQNATNDDEKENKEVLKAFEAINSTAQISLHHEYLLIETLPSFVVEEDEEAPADQKMSCVSGKVLKILFRRIISPNAP